MNQEIKLVDWDLAFDYIISSKVSLKMELLVLVELYELRNTLYGF